MSLFFLPAISEEEGVCPYHFPELILPPVPVAQPLWGHPSGALLQEFPPVPDVSLCLSMACPWPYQDAQDLLALKTAALVLVL